MTTKIFGDSDDNIYTEGDNNGQYSKYGTDDTQNGILLVCSDGSLLTIKYGKGDLGIWGVVVIKQGSLFDHIEYCSDENATIHSDIIYLKDGIKWIFACGDWKKIE